MDFETAKQILRYYICGLPIPVLVLNEAILSVVMHLDGYDKGFTGEENTLYWN